MGRDFHGNEIVDQRPTDLSRYRSRIMYIEDKSESMNGPARIGRVYFSRSGKSLYYRDQTFLTLAGRGFKANYVEVATGRYFWISGVKKDRGDRLYGGRLGVEIDEDVREEYRAILRGDLDNRLAIREET